MAWRAADRADKRFDILSSIKDYKLFHSELKLYLKYHRVPIMEVIKLYSKAFENAKTLLQKAPSFTSMKHFVKAEYLLKKLKS